MILTITIQLKLTILIVDFENGYILNDVGNTLGYKSLIGYVEYYHNL